MFAYVRTVSLIFAFLALKNGVFAGTQTIGPGINKIVNLTEQTSPIRPFPSLFPRPPNSFPRLSLTNNQVPEHQPNIQGIPKLTITHSTFHPLHQGPAGIPSLYPQVEPSKLGNTLTTPISNSLTLNNVLQNNLAPLPAITRPAHNDPNSVHIYEFNNAASLSPENEILTVIDESYPYVTHTDQVDIYGKTPLINNYQSPIVVKVPPMPIMSPSYIVANPYETLPSPNIIPDNSPSYTIAEIYPPLANTEMSLPSVPVETAVVSEDLGYYGQAPVSVQLSTASSWTPEPVITIISPPAQALSSVSSQVTCPTLQPPSIPPQLPYPSFAPPPVIVMEKSKSSLKNLLPILLVSLLDGGNRNNGGGCCSSQGGSLLPFPFPIVIPTGIPNV